jgi:hypothetical protein
MIDMERGELVLEPGGRIGRTTDRATLEREGLLAPGTPIAYLTPLRPQRVSGREVHLRLRFNGRRVRSVFLALAAPDGSPPEDAHELARDGVHRAWLLELLGPPHHAHARGAFYAYDWGWVYACQGFVQLAYPGWRPRVPPPWDTETERADFRCCGCGGVSALPYSRLVLEAFSDRGAAPCPACGATTWVQVGSMTEFHRWSQQPHVCEVGRHHADGVREFELVAESDRPAAPGVLQLAGLRIKSCPAHVEVLRRGFLGCVLRD